MTQAFPITIAFCTYNRAERLPALVAALRSQECPLPYEILCVDNNSKDATAEVLARLAAEPGPPLRVVTETEQGIVPARNRVLAEAGSSDILVCLDDDELPRPGFLAAAVACLNTHPEVQCVGGKVKVDFTGIDRPRWLGDDLLGFLAETDYGDAGFPIVDASTPIWTANIAYRTRVFRDNPELRFDARYSRRGKAVGGGEDVRMFREFLQRGLAMRYCPEMVVDHSVETWRLCRSYFLRLHHTEGFQRGLFELEAAPGLPGGVPLFLYRHLLRDVFRTLRRAISGDRGVLRQAMTASHTLGMIRGLLARRAGEAANGHRAA